MRISIVLAAFLAFSLAILLVSNVARADRYGCHITVTPADPTELDDVDVEVSYFFSTSPPLVAGFSLVSLEGSTYSVNVTVLVPRGDEAVLQIIHLDNQTYHLGQLMAGDYRFEVYRKDSGDTEPWLEQEAHFTVSATTRALPECTSIECFLLLSLFASAYLLTVRKMAHR